MTIIHNGHDDELDYFQAFFGSCYGVALAGRTGDWVRFYILVEDDEHWHVNRNGGGSTFWFPDIMKQMQEARDWMDANLVKGEWGYIVPCLALPCLDLISNNDILLIW